MESIAIYYLVIAVFTLGVIFFIINKTVGIVGKKETDEQREQFAKNNSWKYHVIQPKDDAGSPIWYFTGTSPKGTPWELTTLEHNRGQKFTLRIYIQWRTKALKLDEGVLLIGPTMGGAFKKFDTNNMIVKMMLETFLGDKASDVDNLEKIETDFDEDIAVIAEHPEKVKHFMKKEILSAYIEEIKTSFMKQRPPFIVITDEDFRIKSSVIVKRTQEIEAYIRSAERISDTIKMNL